MKIVKYAGVVIIVIASGLLASLAVVYLFTPSRAVQPSAPFFGDRFVNPYRKAEYGSWVKAIFHVHSDRSDGKEPPCDIVKKYKSMNFTYVGISDHNMITDTSKCNDMYLAEYEHGLGVRNWHYTAVGCSRTVMEWYPLFQGVDQKQKTIDRLHEVCPFVVINHPGRDGAFTPSDFDLLDSYNAMEVLNNKWEGTEPWDRALSAGRVVWGFAGDDNHDIENSSTTGFRFVDIDIPAHNFKEVLYALFQGLFTIVRLKNPSDAPIRLKSLSIAGDDLEVEADVEVDEIRFIGQGGNEHTRALKVNRAKYKLMPADTYIRIEFHKAGSVTYLNPVFRHTR
jgi:hypothetical protein